MGGPALQGGSVDPEQFTGFLVGVEDRAIGRVHHDGHRQLAHQVAVARFAVAQPPVGRRLVERHFHHGAQLPLGEGLDHIPGRLDMLGALERFVLGIGGQEHHRNRMARADDAGRLDAVHGTAQPDVHQDQVRAQSARHGDGLLSADRMPDRLIAMAAQLDTDVQRHDGFVFHDQDTGSGHGVAGKWQWAQSMVQRQCRQPRCRRPSGEYLKVPQ